MGNDTQQVISRQRVIDHGEVFTSEREVKAMVDLVDNEAQRVDSRFLEPACGTGNFLIEVLSRKLSVVKSRYKKLKSTYEAQSLLAISSIYGIDILEDSIATCKERLFEYFEEEYEILFKGAIDKEVLDSARFLLDKNIVRGDALTMKLIDSEVGISFVEWALIKDKFKGQIFRFADIQQTANVEDDLFNFAIHTSDTGEDIFLPKSISEYPLTEYNKLYELGRDY